MSQDSIPDIETIKATLNRMAGSALATSAKELLATLGYKSERVLPGQTGNPHELIGDLPDTQAKQEFVEQAQTTHLIFQITDSELSQASLFVEDKVDKGQLQSYVFIAITLKGEDYSRTSLARMTRLLNKQFPMPVMVLFRYGAEDSQQLSIAIINRRRHRRDEDKEVLGKVTIIHGINLASPHRGHLDILASFSVARMKNHQTINNFDTLHTAWEDVFNVQLLNKRFYRQLSDWYFWALSQVQFPDDVEKDPKKRNATNLIRLLTRLIFCWFLKEKGLIPSRLFEQDKLSSILKSLKPEESTFYHAILQNLFFATLNQKMGTDNNGNSNRKFAKDGGFQRNRNDHGLYNLYRYESLFQGGEDAALQEFADIPFLNGGLFECLDHEDENNRVQYVDGFSRNPRKQARVPNKLFFGEVRTVDLSEPYDDTTCKNQRVGGLIPILNAYKFTIVENTPVDQEIALDPELLGMVFENLLASYNPETETTARKQTGSFYTPRPIVDYMVDESLKAHLAATLTHNADMGEADATAGLEMLFTYTEKEHPFTPHEAKALIGAIDTCKILDPACGSGAFPMGALHKLVFILQKLDPHNEQWKQRQIETAENILDIQARDSAIQAIERDFEDNELDYGRKLYLIENCLYGVDIQPIAIQIAKLRFFISLVCDQKINRENDNHGIRPLPNLETKFVAADTLVILTATRSLTRDLSSDKTRKLEKDLRTNKERYFHATSRARKHECQNNDKKLREALAKELREIGMPPDAADKIARWDFMDQNTYANWFDIEYMFGIINGFDIVIGNPPYLRMQGIRESTPKKVDFYKEHYDSATGSFDLYVIFMERGMQFLKEKGILNYISPDKWVNASFGKGIRGYALKKRNVHKVISFGAHQVFSACTYSSLVWMGTEPSSSILYDKIEPPDGTSISLNEELEKIKFSHIPYSQLSSDSWILTSGANTDVMNKILLYPRKLGSVFSKIFQGIASSKDSVYFLRNAQSKGDYYTALSLELNEPIEIEKGLVKPLLLGNQVHRYENLQTSNLVVFPYNLPADAGGKAVLMSASQIASDFPKGWEYLSRCESVLRRRERGRFDNNQWYQFGRKQGIDNGYVEKLLAPDISLGGNFSIDYTGEYYTTTTLYGYLKKAGVWESYEYWLALLNSSVLWFYLRNSGSVLANGYFRYKPAYLGNFPIPSPTQQQEKTIFKLTRLILLANRNGSSERRGALTLLLESIIDACVFELYFLDHMQERDLLLQSYIVALLDEYDPEASGSKQQEFLEHFYQTANAPDHPIRNRLLRLTADSPNLLGVIRGASVI